MRSKNVSESGGISAQQFKSRKKSIIALFLGIVMVFGLTPVAATYATGDISISATAIPSASLSIGDEFSTTLSISGNPGFAAMIMRVRIPQGLELTGFTLHNHSELSSGFRGPRNWDEAYAVYPPISGDIFAGWAGRTTNFTGNGNLITYTFRVAENAVPGAVKPITIAFANADGYEVPTNASLSELEISLPGGATNFGESGIIGNATIRGTIGVSITPSTETIGGEVDDYVTFNVEVWGMPGNYTFYLDNRETNGAGRIEIAFPNDVRDLVPSGYVTTLADGTGSGTLTITVVCARVCWCGEDTLVPIGQLFSKPTYEPAYEPAPERMP